MPPIANPPAEDEWVQWIPPSTEHPAGVARLSEPAAIWILQAVSALWGERELREVEHTCLDDHEKAGVIRQ